MMIYTFLFANIAKISERFTVFGLCFVKMIRVFFEYVKMAISSNKFWLVDFL